MNRNFEQWLSKMKRSIATYNYYVDFDKIYRNVDNIKVELNIMNSLIGSENIEADFNNLLNLYPEILKCIPILLAVRGSEIYVLDGEKDYCFNFFNKNYANEDYINFMEESGLFNLIKNKKISNLLDYVTGVETGLDSNGRKNRGGHLMEDLVESAILDAGFELNKTYFKELKSDRIHDMFNLDLSQITNKGKTVKRWDFVVKTETSLYLIETNFYASGGSKLNETARSYKMIASEANNLDNIKFVWFTDGRGWISARNNLQETFEVMEHIYNINDIENQIIKKVFI